ncbi:30S ribosomal protein S8 [Candidatus Giovannonibacteria bacterium]|nr:30S ribosomal protein S8 [Candidatus Giovannonibacteria bacterium]
MTDPIADMLIRLRNAQAVKKETVSIPYSNLKWDIAKILEESRYVGVLAKKGKKSKKFIEIKLNYTDGAPRISGAKRVSKPSKRVYKGYREIFPVKNKYGTGVYSTPSGLLTDEAARKNKVGGELLFEIW